MGQMQVNSLEKLAKIHVSLNQDRLDHLFGPFFQPKNYPDLANHAHTVTIPKVVKAMYENEMNKPSTTNSSSRNDTANTTNKTSTPANNSSSKNTSSTNTTTTINTANKNDDGLLTNSAIAKTSSSNTNVHVKNEIDIMSGYLIYDCKTYGKVVLLYHSHSKI